MEQIVKAFQPYIVPFCAVMIIGGISLWAYTDRKFRERQREERMFDEVNSKAYDEENIQ